MGTRRRLAGISLVSFLAAAALALVVGGVLMYVLTRWSPTVLAAQLTLDHVKCFAVDRPTASVDATASEQQFARDHGWKIYIPRAANPDLRLVGVRQCFCADGGATAHVMYRYQGRPMSLYMLPDVSRPAASADAFGHDAVIWSTQGTTYVLVGREPPAAMERLAWELGSS
jgi:hypothetical protein